jgi:hypothetical protein
MQRPPAPLLSGSSDRAAGILPAREVERLEDHSSHTASPGRRGVKGESIGGFILDA